MSSHKQIEDIVSLLDNFVKDGAGHMNITVEHEDDTEQVNIETFRSNDCGTNKINPTSCMIPTLQEGMDSE